MLTVYDANNWARRQLEVGRSVKDCVEDIRYSPAPTIVVWDGFGGNERRRADYPGYKAKRQPLTESMTNSFKFIRDLLQMTPVIQMKIAGYEADDVIAQLARTSGEKLFLYSRDMDLAAIPNVKLAEERELPCAPDKLRLYKTLVGDPSDNIPGLKGFGKKAWEKLSAFDQHYLQGYFAGESATLDRVKFDGLAGRILANWVQLRIFWKIIGFYPIPKDEFDAAVNLGTLNEAALKAVYSEYML